MKLIKILLEQERKLTLNNFVQMVRDDMSAGSAPDEYASDDSIMRQAKYLYSLYLQGASVDDLFEVEQEISEERLKVKDLRFGTHIQRGDHLPTREDSQVKIFSQEYIDRWIQDTGLTGEEEVILNPNAEAWFDRIKIPALTKDSEEFAQQKAQSLKQLGTTN